MSKDQPALRISQLDAGELDTDLIQILRSRLKDCFKYFKQNWMITYDPELNAALRFLLWKFTIFDRDATIGQQLLDLKYRRLGGGGFTDISRRQKVMFAALTIVGPWLTQRAQTLSMLTNRFPFSAQFWKFIRHLELFWKIASLLNFLVFLTQGRYQYVVERVVGIRAMFPKPQGVRQIGFEYMDRELLWHGFAEFLFFILPLVNFRKIKNFFVRTMLSRTTTQSAVERCMADYKECVVCGEWPYNPHDIGCKHVFCYYCVQANYEADPGFSCPICGYKISDQDCIVPVKILTTTLIDAT